MELPLYLEHMSINQSSKLTMLDKGIQRPLFPHMYRLTWYHNALGLLYDWLLFMVSTFCDLGELALHWEHFGPDEAHGQSIHVIQMCSGFTCGRVLNG